MSNGGTNIAAGGNAAGGTNIATGGDAYMNSVISGVQYDDLGRPVK